MPVDFPFGEATDENGQAFRMRTKNQNHKGENVMKKSRQNQAAGREALESSVQSFPMKGNRQ
jgi:hypothetical protein